MTELQSNIELTETCFLVILHETNFFDVKAMEVLISDVGSLVFNEKVEPTNKVEIHSVFRIFGFVSDFIIAHHNPLDLYKIENFDQGFMVYFDRFKFTIEMVLSENKEGILNYEDDFGKIIIE